MPDFDAIIIGTGQAGPSLAFRLAGAGMKVAVVERHLVGGTCVNTGCTPTKALVASAYAARTARRAAEYGVVIGGDIGIDMRRVKARMDAIVAASRNGLTSALENAANITLYRGHAGFASPQSVEVAPDHNNTGRLRAGRIFINVGGRALVPPMPGINEVPYLTNSSMMDVDFLPHHLIIVGGSYIGLEFGQMYRRFGSRVTIIEMAPRLVRHEDEDVSAAIKEIVEREGIEVRLNAECISLAKRGDNIVAKVDCTVGAPEVAGSHLLLAVGRRPNTDDLDLDKAGVRCDERGYIIVDDRLQTTAPGIWALGDCNGKGAFTHTAYNDFGIVAANLLDHDPRRVSERITAYALYTDPPLGRVGMTLAEARNSGRRVLAGERPMTRVARAVEKGETQGFMRILVDGDSKEILGASLLGTGCDEAVHAILDLMYAKAPYTVMQRAMHIHPTVSELLPTILGDLKSVAQRQGGKIEMEDHDIRAVLDRHWAASDANDFEAEHQIYREDAVLEYPQSGERIRGRRNIQASRFAQPNRKHFTVRRIVGAANLWVTEFVLTYDGRPSYTVSIMEFSDGKVARETQYFADPFEPGPSRAQWVELMR